MRHTEILRHNRNNKHIILGQKVPEARHAVAHEALSGHVKTLGRRKWHVPFP